MARTEPGAPHFLSLAGGGFARILRNVVSRLRIPDYDRYSSNCLRRGAANAILASGPTLSGIMRKGGWKTTIYRAYLDIREPDGSSTLAVLAGYPPPPTALPRRRKPHREPLPRANKQTPPNDLFIPF